MNLAGIEKKNFLSITRNGITIEYDLDTLKNKIGKIYFSEHDFGLIEINSFEFNVSVDNSEAINVHSYYIAKNMNGKEIVNDRMDVRNTDLFFKEEPLNFNDINKFLSDLDRNIQNESIRFNRELENLTHENELRIKKLEKSRAELLKRLDHDSIPLNMKEKLGIK